MDLTKLKAFTVVAEELNFRRSAERLGMSQPPLTRLISGLEDELGVKLFERTTRKVDLTGAGVLLLKEAREILGALKRIETEVRGAAKLKSGIVRIGFSRTVFMVRFPALIEEFKERFPKIRLDLHELTTKEILKALREDRLDLGFVERATEEHDLKSHRVDEEILGALLPRKHPLATRKEVTFQDLENETIILHNRREADEFHDRIAKLIQGLPRKPRIYIKAPQESCPVLVATGKGIALTIAGSQNFAPGQTRFVPIREMFLPVSVFWKPENESPSVKSLLSFVIEKKSVLDAGGGCLVFTP